MLIFHLPQEESLPRHGGTCGAAVTTVDHFAETLYRHLAAADLHEGSDNSAHHIAQEAVGGDDKDPLMIAKALPAGIRHTADVGLDVGMEL